MTCLSDGTPRLAALGARPAPRGTGRIQGEQMPTSHVLSARKGMTRRTLAHREMHQAPSVCVFGAETGRPPARAGDLTGCVAAPARGTRAARSPEVAR